MSLSSITLKSIVAAFPSLSFGSEMLYLNHIIPSTLPITFSHICGNCILFHAEVLNEGSYHFSLMPGSLFSAFRYLALCSSLVLANSSKLSTLKSLYLSLNFSGRLLNASLLVHVSISVPPHEELIMPTGIFNSLFNLRAKKYATAENSDTV